MALDLSRYPADDLFDARASRNRAWMDRMKDRITSDELYEVLAHVRRLHGDNLYGK